MGGLALRASMRAYEALFWSQIARAAASPERAQRQVLATLLSRNSGTRFGVEHGFADTRDPQRFQERVAVQEYGASNPQLLAGLGERGAIVASRGSPSRSARPMSLAIRSHWRSLPQWMCT